MKRNQTNLPDLSGMVPVLPDHGPRPRALYSALRRMIEEGQLRPGTKLPPTRELAAQLQIARGAVVSADGEGHANGTVKGPAPTVLNSPGASGGMRAASRGSMPTAT